MITAASGTSARRIGGTKTTDVGDKAPCLIVHRGFPPSEVVLLRSSAISRNCSGADSRSFTISAGKTSGSGKFSVSSRDSSRIQKMSRFALSRATSSS